MGSRGDSSGVVAEQQAPTFMAVELEPEPDSRLLIEVSRHDGDWSFLEPVDANLSSAAAALSTVLGDRLSKATAAVALSSDAEVRQLNAGWRGHDKPTNVLSFPSRFVPPTPSERRFVGDVVLAEETIKREAMADGIPLTHHVMHLVVHGVLHLVGYDHETETDAARMEALEVEVLAKLGICDPYQ